MGDYFADLTGLVAWYCQQQDALMGGYRMGSIAEPEFVNLRTAASLAGVSYDTVRRLAASGELATFERGVDRRSRLVRVADIRRLAAVVAA